MTTGSGTGRIEDRTEIAAALAVNRPLHIYEIGDLDDFFWPYTVWYAHRRDGVIDAIALLYTGMEIPTLIALTDEAGRGPLRAVLAEVAAELPDRLDAHVTAGLRDVLEESFVAHSRGWHYKMALRPERLPADRTEPPQRGGGYAAAPRSMPGAASPEAPVIEQLGRENLAEVTAFYAVAYPGNWFDPRMLETEKYFGVRVDGALASVAGVHVYSPEYGVAALGNIATVPSRRGCGLATLATARLCHALIEEGLTVGLNVAAENQPALASYRKLGFVTIAEYEEVELRRRFSDTA